MKSHIIIQTKHDKMRYQTAVWNLEIRIWEIVGLL